MLLPNDYLSKGISKVQTQGDKFWNKDTSYHTQAKKMQAHVMKHNTVARYSSIQRRILEVQKVQSKLQKKERKSTCNNWRT